MGQERARSPITPIPGPMKIIARRNMERKHYKELPTTLSGPVNYDLLPEHMWGAMERYYWDGIPPGGFLTSVLANELMQSVMRADIINSSRLKEIVQFVCWHLPAVCHGSPQAVASWVVKGGANGGEPRMEKAGTENESSEV